MPVVLGMSQLFPQSSDSDVLLVGAETEYYNSRPSNSLRGSYKMTGSGRAIIFPMAFNKSCDECGIRKRKCDGNRPCSRCVQKGIVNTCNFSRRKAHKPHKPHKPRHRLRGAMGSTADSPTTHYSPGVQSLKRCRLSASPATGLVGMVENEFLSDYFAGFGFLPFTSQSQIRETIVRMMVLANKKQMGGMVTSPSMCTFWCAVALGALIKGVPIESVGSYFGLAKDSLDRFSGPPTPEAIGAYAILGYVHGFVGNDEGLSLYIKQAGSFIQTFTDRNEQDQLPVGLAEVILSVEEAKLKIDSKQIQASHDEEITPPQMSPFPTEGEVYRYLTLTHQAIGQAYAKVAAEQDTCSLSRVDGNDIDDTTEQGGGDGGNAASKEHGRPTGLRAVMERFEESSFELHILEKALERPGIRGGVGGLTINMILLFVSTVGKDPRQTLERVMNTFEVFERYPGLFRFLMWSHYGHFIALLFKTLDGANGREYYDRLRATFNRVRPPEFKALPPFDEWRGMESICVKACCRESEALLMKEFGPNNEEDTESVGLENGEESSSCDSRSLSDSGDGGLQDQVNIGVDYRDRDVEDGIDPGLGELGSPEMAILSATVEGERLVTPHPIWLTQKSHWNGEMKNGVECDTIPGADGIVAEEWNEVANMLNV